MQVSVIQALTGSDRHRKYSSDLKTKLKKEGSKLSEKIGQLKLIASDGKFYKIDVANTEQLFRLIQRIAFSPHKKKTMQIETLTFKLHKKYKLVIFVLHNQGVIKCISIEN